MTEDRIAIEGQGKKRKIVLDWDDILNRPDEEPLEVEVVRPGPKKPSPLPPPPPLQINARTEMVDVDPSHFTDDQLDETIIRQRRLLKLSLPDNGTKVRNYVKSLEDEKERRRLVQRDVGRSVKREESPRFCVTGCSNGSGVERKSSQSAFGSSFCRKIDEENAGCNVVNSNAFDEQLKTLNPCGRLKTRSSSCPSDLKPPKKIARNGGQCANRADVDCAFFYSAREISGGSNRSPANRKSATKLNGSRRRKEQTVVVVDEDEQQVFNAIEQVPKFPDCDKDARLYYPSRDHPESVEIRCADLDCLAPGAFLTSPVMNFYIQYLQQQASPTSRAICDCHFFNTFFYKKLKEDISFKGNNKSYTFAKFRRWWKGVNIFQKAYILIPVHEDLHWSLVIICIPDKQDELGPIILHFDSLELHCRDSVFQNIKSFLSEEWSYLCAEETPFDLPIPGKIWKNLPRRIEKTKISVPQQKNDYDCGLFVLYFMERFIEEAPERLRKKDLDMFGKQWFKPEEASSLREKILNILGEQFQNVR